MSRRLFRQQPADLRERGATAVEYALIASLIAVVIAVAVAAVGTQVVALYQAAADGFP
ncbi:Flp family type IVb pilin [Ornithinimicrobium cryptoxanthini]|uniref:Flp family type IVb pilin n=1 Tax=Ornithinimicrobium cryptoxanthini TaxID=2934161 RepID=A0ABY4YLF9_9MICO|nr:Flp family type IVb pilin [Ornithinimicrobium cryptoxanthini]USQ77462.1 Flp family type IVb pilin [Ornithinimicrobium cryptoxanthini]